MVTKQRNTPELESESETPQSEPLPNFPDTGDDPTTPFNDLGIIGDSLPKLVVCFDIGTMSHRKLKTIASDLKLPGYSRMTKTQLCEALLAL